MLSQSLGSQQSEFLLARSPLGRGLQSVRRPPSCYPCADRLLGRVASLCSPGGGRRPDRGAAEEDGGQPSARALCRLDGHELQLQQQLKHLFEQLRWQRLRWRIFLRLQGEVANLPLSRDYRLIYAHARFIIVISYNQYKQIDLLKECFSFMFLQIWIRVLIETCET